MCDGLRMCVDVACVRASEVCWFGFEGGLLGAAWVLEGSGVCKFCSNGTPILKLAVHPF